MAADIPVATRAEPACHSADVETGTGSPVAAGGSPALPQTTRMVRVPDCLGALGLSAAAEALEDYADQTTKFSPLITDSLQQVADWLRQVAIQVPEAA